MAEFKPLKWDTTNELARRFETGDSVGPVHGGTGQSAVAAGDLLYGSGVDTWSRLPVGTPGQFLWITGGVPTWRTLTTSDISSLAEFVEDQIDNLLRNGTGTIWTYDDAGGTGQVDLDINGLTAETAPAPGDAVALYDLSEGAANKCTLANLPRGFSPVGFAAKVDQDTQLPTTTFCTIGDNASTSTDIDCTELYDTTGDFANGVTGVWNVPFTGYYLCIIHSNWASLSNTGQRLARIYNYTTATVLAYDYEPGSATYTTGGKIAVVLSLTAGDDILFQVWQDQGGNMNLSAGTYAAAQFLGA